LSEAEISCDGAGARLVRDQATAPPRRAGRCAWR